MKRVLMALALAGVLTLTASAASTLTKIRADIPFAFTAGTLELPAGTYEIERLSTPSALVLINAATGDRVLVRASLNYYAANTTKPNLRFVKYGERVFLDAVSDNSWGASLQVVKSRAERELARTFGKPVPVAMNR